MKSLDEAQQRFMPLKLCVTLLLCQPRKLVSFGKAKAIVEVDVNRFGNTSGLLARHKSLEKCFGLFVIHKSQLKVALVSKVFGRTVTVIDKQYTVVVVRDERNLVWVDCSVAADLYKRHAARKPLCFVRARQGFRTKTQHACIDLTNGRLLFLVGHQQIVTCLLCCLIVKLTLKSCDTYHGANKQQRVYVCRHIRHS